MCINISEDDLEDDENKTLSELKIEAVLERMWKFNQTYKLSNVQNVTDDQREPVWYIMDEFGSSLRHNNEPTVKCSPFFYLATNTMFTIMWPLVDLEHGDEITRDYVYGVKDAKLRKAKLVPWNLDDDEDEHIPNGVDPTIQHEPDTSYFMSARENEVFYENQPDSDLKCPLDLSSSIKIKVFTDLEFIKTNLTDDRYTFTNEVEKADIIFIRNHFKDYKDLHDKLPLCMVNQFPFENVVTIKDMLAVVCRRVNDSSKWLPITYNLAYELPIFVEYFKQRQDLDLDNHWIIKPWNLARSIDTTVTKNLEQIIRSQETGPKIVSKYITEPVLFYREELNASVKFDIRYIVMVRSIKPMVIYTYKVFWLRFANKSFSLDNLDDYEKHFTVMNYRPINLRQIGCEEFVPLFEQQYQDFKWKDLESKMFKMIRQVFEGASQELPPKGIAHNLQSRAMYAVDLMLDWRNDKKVMEPMICEVNFMPDCSRACQFHPNFFNDVFNTLFLDDLNHNQVNKI